MAANKMGAETQEKIIDAAQTIFLEKGFDKTRMEDIAAKAEITKAMLYYHFDSKENLLKELMRRLMQQAKDAFSKGFMSFPSLSLINPAAVKEKIFGLLMEKKGMIRLVSRETMRGTVPISMMIDLFKDFFDQIFLLVEKRGIKIKNKEEALVKIFFFQSMPIVMYMNFYEEFSKENNLDIDKVAEVFVSKFIDTMIRTIRGK